MSSNNTDITNILSYGVLEAPEELELLVKSKLSSQAVLPQRSNMGMLAGWLPVTFSILGLVAGLFTSVIMFFPKFSFALEFVNKIFKFILSPSVMVIVLSILALILLDSLLEKRIRFKLG